MSERSERVESPPAYVTNEFHAAIFAWHCVLSVALLCSGGNHLGRGEMPLHDAVMMNCKEGATTKNQGECVKYMG